MKRRGFTLIGLVVAAVLLGLLAIVAIPKYYDSQTDAKTAAEKGVVDGVRARIYAYFAKNKIYPAMLDHNANGACVTCFGAVLGQGGVKDASWTKAGLVYTGPTGTTYTYDGGTSGAFV